MFFDVITQSVQMHVFVALKLICSFEQILHKTYLPNDAIKAERLAGIKSLNAGKVNWKCFTKQDHAISGKISLIKYFQEYMK